MRKNVSETEMLCCDWWRPTSALNLRGCYFTIGGGAFKVHVSEDEASQKDVCLADVNLKLHCSLQQEQRGQKNGQEQGGGGTQRGKERWNVDVEEVEGGQREEEDKWGRMSRRAEEAAERRKMEKRGEGVWKRKSEERMGSKTKRGGAGGEEKRRGREKG